MLNESTSSNLKWPNCAKVSVGTLKTPHVVEALATLHGLELGLGSVAAVQRQVSRALAGVVETARQILSGRGQEQAKQVIGRRPKGIITTDRYNAYRWLGVKRRQICWAHLKRDFQAISERDAASAEIGQSLLEQTDKLFALWRQFREGTLTRRQFQIRVRPIKAEFGKLLRLGAENENPKTGATCRQILQLERSLWTFVRTPAVEPTNNQAERSLRRGVLWRKKSFGSQSQEGTRFVERILTAVTILRQQKRDVLEFLTTACWNSAARSQPLDL